MFHRKTERGRCGILALFINIFMCMSLLLTNCIYSLMFCCHTAHNVQAGTGNPVPQAAIYHFRKSYSVYVLCSTEYICWQNVFYGQA